MNKTIGKLCLFAVFTLSFIAAMCFSASAETDGYYTYEVVNKEAVIVEVDPSISGNITIPEKLGKYKVTTLSSDAFYDCIKITSVTIPSTVTQIGYASEGYYDLPFYGCDAIKSFKVDSNNKYFSTDKNGVLFNKNKTVLLLYPPSGAKEQYTVPSTVKTIASSAFNFSSGEGFLSESPKKLKKVTISKNVKSIPVAFWGCSSLREFEVVKENKYFANDNSGVLYNKNMTTLIKYPEAASGSSFVVPDSVKAIEFGAFSRNTKLKTVYLPKNITHIEDIFFDPYVESNIKNVYYGGTKSQWNKLDKGIYDEEFIYPNVKIVFSSAIPVSSESLAKKVSVSQTTASVSLKWSKVTGATGYRVYKYDSKKKKYVHIASVKQVSYKATKLKPGTSYKFKIRPYTKLNSGTVLWGAYSDVFQTATKPSAPKITKLTTSKGKAGIEWSNVAGETGYQVYYSTKKDSGFKKAASYKANVVKASKGSLTSKKTYYFKVRAYTKTPSGTVFSSFSPVKSVKIK